jgi:HPt (histidine-containing phosphotransfer) domain-containing protein
MARTAASLPADDVPRRCPSSDRPIDLVHLARQTAGDSGLEREVLDLMSRQIDAFSDRIALATEDERRHIAHALKGAARNVGAFALARAAEAFELAPRAAAAHDVLTAEMRRASAFIAALRR